MNKKHNGILIISNQVRSAQILVGLIQEAHFNVQVCPNNQERLNQIEDQAVDLILLDVWGQENIIGVIGMVREIGWLNRLPMLLGIEQEWDEQLPIYSELGVKEFITKPYQREMLDVRIKNMLEYMVMVEDNKQKTLEFEALFNNTPYMTWFKDEESRYVKVNKEFVDHSGKTAQAIKGQVDHFVWDGHIGERCRDYDLQVMKERKQVAFDEIIPGVKGYRQFNIYKAPLINEKNEVMGTIGIARDITEIKNKDTKFNVIMENIPFSVYLKDLEGKMVDVNTKFSEFFNVPLDGIIGKEATCFVDEEYVRHMLVHDAAVIKNGKHMVFEEKIRTFAGERVIEIHKSPVFDIGNEVIGIVGLFRDVTDLMEAGEEIKRLAYCDSLTGLPNRTGLYHYIDHEVSQKETYLTVMFIDLDNFKQLNDTCGHQYGDEALMFIASKLKETSESAFVARIGGDEFVVVWENIVSEDLLREKAEEILAVMTTEFNKDDRLNIISASMGIVSGNSKETSIDNLLAKGDIALSKAKERGKNSYVFYTAEIEEERLLNLEIEKDIKQALKKKEIILFYQPQFTSEGVLKGFEALFRWQNSKYNKVPVINIIKIIERCNLIDLIGDYIISEAFKFAKKINSYSAVKLLVSVNISAIQIMNRNFVQKVKALIEEVGVDPELVGIEITETVLLENIDKNIEKIKALKDFGLTISLDDFGTGYSSFSYLVKLPLSLVKIDRSFVQGMGTGEEYARLVRLMIDATHSLGLPVVAEGVETERELGILKEMEVDYIQGYLFSKPLPEKEAESMVIIK